MPSPLSHNLPWELANQKWAQSINPVLANPLSSGSILNGITLINGETVINHGLGRLMQGFLITDINGAATIYRSQPMNAQTLSLTSSAVVTVSIEVF